MYIYQLVPIDFGWENLKTVACTAADLGAKKAEYAALGQRRDGAFLDVDEFLSTWETAKRVASGRGWEGDFREGPVVFWLPFDDNFQYGFVFKQDNNGTTFVVSPVEMPWLREA